MSSNTIKKKQKQKDNHSVLVPSPAFTFFIRVSSTKVFW